MSLKTKIDSYICYTLTITKDRRDELLNFFDEVFFDTNYEIIGDTVVTDVNEAHGTIYDDVLTNLPDFSLRFYIERQQQKVTTAKLKNIPHGILIQIEDIAFSEEKIMREYKQQFMLTDGCEIIFDTSALSEHERPIQIMLQPKNVFGTGTHMSTKLAAQLLERHTKVSDSLIDVGTGTGILAIYAAKRGVKSVLAVDSDPLAISEATMNVQKNGVSEYVSVKQNDFLRDMDLAGFTLMLANLSLNLYKQFLPELIPTLSSIHTLLFSGVIEAEQQAFEALLTDAQLTIKDKIIESGWVAYYVQRNE